MTKQSILKVAGITGVILLIPLVAMQFTDEVDWQLGDFLVGGGLLFGFGLLIQWAWHKYEGRRYRLLFIFGIVVVLILIWMELAVGIFGTPWAGS